MKTKYCYSRPKLVITILVAILITFPVVVKAQRKDIRTKIDSLVSSYMLANKMVGISIGIVKDEKIYLAKGYGNAEVNTMKPVDSLTNFLACSITKLFTATAIMQLVEEGKLDISQKLIHYLPDFKMKDDRYKDITLEHLLTHTSGLYWDMELDHSPNDSSALRKLVYSLDDKILDFAPGTKFDATKTYSNAAFDILGYLIQKTSGLPYDEYIKQHIFLKTKMSYSTMDYKKVPVDRRSSPHILKHKKAKVGGMWTENTEHAPSGNLNTCSLDLCFWMLHYLDICNQTKSFEGVIKSSTLQNMWTTRRIAPQNDRVSIGLGWFITDSKDLGKYYWHVGNNPGFSGILLLFPKLNLGITVLSNGMYAEQIVWNKIPFDIISLLNSGMKE